MRTGVRRMVKMLTPRQVATRLGISVDQVYRLIESKKLPAKNVGVGTRPRWRVDESDLEGFH